MSAVGDGFDNFFYGHLERMPGLAGPATIVLLLILSLLQFHEAKIYGLVNSPAALIIQKGNLLPGNLARERTRTGTVLFELRLAGEEHLRDIEEARWEPEGQISILKTRVSKPIKKKEADRLG